METLPSARAFWVTRPGHGEIREESLTSPRDGELLVRAEFSGISRGTESIVFNGRVPVSEYGRMRAPFQSGEFPAPVKYGYASVGTVEQGSDEWRGRRVFVLYPHQTRYVVPAAAVHAVPDSVPAGRAVLAANMETAINGCWDATPAPDDRVTVVGGGTVGCLVGWVIRQMAGCEVELVDLDPAREPIARTLGLTFVSAGQMSQDRTIVIHTSASEAGLRTALEIAAADGVIVEMSWFGDRQVSLPLGQAFHSRRLTLRSSQVGSIPPSHRGEWDTRRRMALALDLLKSPALDVLITGESDLDDLPSVMPRLAASPAGTLCHRIRY